MPTRLVLGCGRDCRVLIDRLAERGDLLAVVDDDAEAEWLAERDVSVERADPTDASALARLADPESVVVAVEGDERSDRAVAAAREAFPAASVVVRGGSGAAGADRRVDPTGVVAERVLEHVASPAGRRALELRSVLHGLEEPLAVVMHDNPDPDAIASAVALSELAADVGVEAVPCYFGTIAHQENRALVNLLELDLRELEAPDEVEAFGSIALVDHARPGVNDQLPADTPVDVVIDHHPTHGPDEVAFIDLRSGVGSTSTLLTEYFDLLDVPLTSRVATALLYGLRVDTDDFTREVAAADFEAAATLVPAADHGVLERVESPSVSGDTLAVLARAIENRNRHGTILTAGVGEIGDTDALAQAADRLLDLEDVTTTVVFGIVEDTVHVSARARGARIDLGQTLRAAFDRLGSAGGHEYMAGAQVPVGMLVEPDDEDPAGIVETVMTEAFLEAVETSHVPASTAYSIAGDEPTFRTSRERN